MNAIQLIKKKSEGKFRLLTMPNYADNYELFTTQGFMFYWTI